MVNINFSILGYYPTLLSNENITVGILFENLDKNEFKFIVSKNWQRVINFDDEVDVEYVKKYLNGISIEVENNLIYNQKDFGIQEYIKKYVNQFKFGKVMYCEYESFDEFVLLTEKTYMKSNFSKEERLSSKDSLKIIKKVMKTSGIAYKTNSIHGKHGENINYDFIVNDFGFKSFFVGGKDYKQLVTAAKSWAFNSNEMKNEYNTVFVCDDDLFLPEYSILKDILYEDSKYIINNKDLFSFIQKTCVNQIEIK